MFPCKTNVAILFVITTCFTNILLSSALDFSFQILRNNDKQNHYTQNNHNNHYNHNNHHNHYNSGQFLARAFLDAHNTARREVGLNPVVWDADLAAYASSYASQRVQDCALAHSHGAFGENIACSSGEMTAGDAVKMWVDEKRYYEDGSATCNAPDGGTCLHYTQVCWKNTVRIGCAKVRCNNGGTFITCNYYPPGNYVGQKPY